MYTASAIKTRTSPTVRMSLCIPRLADRAPVLLILLTYTTALGKLNALCRCRTVRAATWQSVQTLRCGLDGPGFGSQQAQETFL
jgi:hypothetical protein